MTQTSKKISDWLNITDQQLNILKTILKLQKEKALTTPKDISERYNQLYGKSIQRSNLFSQIKTLSERNMIVKAGKANYKIHFDGIKRELSTVKDELMREVNDFEEVSGEIESYFEGLLEEGSTPTVKFYAFDEMFEYLSEVLKHAERYLVVRGFPSIFYPTSPSLRTTKGERKYAEVLWNETIIKKRLKTIYLTTSSVDYLYSLLVKEYNEPEIAYSECKFILDHAKSILKTGGENLEVYYVDFIHGFDWLIPDGPGLDEFFMMLRDQQRVIIGGIYIKFPQLANQVKKIFMRECKLGEKLEKLEGKKLGKKFSEMHRMLEILKEDQLTKS